MRYAVEIDINHRFIDAKAVGAKAHRRSTLSRAHGLVTLSKGGLR